MSKLRKKVTVISIDKEIKALEFPIRDFKKPLEIRLYPTPSGEVTTFVRTDEMVAENLPPIPIMLDDFQWVIGRLAKRIFAERKK